MQNMYQSSKGPIAIDTMPLSYARNALAKLERDDEQKHRTAEKGWLAAHIRKLEDAPPTDEPNRGIGGNNPPPEAAAAMKWDAIKAHMDDLLLEARAWADGEPITSDGMASALGTLRNQLRDAEKLASASRIAEKKPHDDAAKEIQDRYNVYIAPLKNKTPGSILKADQALGELAGAWLRKLEKEKADREEAARAKAAEAEAAARQAHMQAAGSGDLNAKDEAEDLMAAAEVAAKELRQAEKEKVQIKGEGRAMGLRSRWRAQLEEKGGSAALLHYAKTHPERMKAFLQQMADEDVRAGVRHIPGFSIIEERVA